MEIRLDLIHGDCLEKMKSIADKSIDLIICDLPYGCLTNQTGSACAWDIKIDLTAFWIQVKRIRRSDSTPTIHFCNTKFGNDLIESNKDEFRYDLVWSKSCAAGFLLANKMPLRSHEMIYIFSKKGANYNRIDIKGDFPKYENRNGKSNVFSTLERKATDSSAPAMVGDGVRCVKSVVEVANKKGRGNHPTQKPEELYRWLIERYSNEGDTVLDPTAGSFTSVLTAYDMNRNAIGIEMNEAFYKKACGLVKDNLDIL